jgi:excinuclease ABC subunit B
MKATIEECERRRHIQLAFNKEHHITPQTIEKAIREGIEGLADEETQEVVLSAVGQNEEEYAFANIIARLEREMELAARNLQFERAAAIRDKIKEMKHELNMEGNT